MNNKTLKIIAVFLALILAIPAFALFADGPDGPPDDTNQTEIETGDTSAGGAGEELTVPETEFPFEDVYDNTPIHPIILYVYSNGILKGVSDTRFAPGAKLTRAMAVTIIHRTYLLTASDSIEAADPVIETVEETVPTVEETAAADAQTASEETAAVPEVIEEAAAEVTTDVETTANVETTTEFEVTTDAETSTDVDAAAAAEETAAPESSDQEAAETAEEIEEVPTVAGFVDVAEDAYYAEAVRWATENGIVMGVSETEFAPDATLTIEQLCAMMFRYAQSSGIVKENFRGSLRGYEFASDLHDWARDAAAWAMKLGFLRKNSTSAYFAPLYDATRIQTAYFIYLICGEKPLDIDWDEALDSCIAVEIANEPETEDSLASDDGAEVIEGAVVVDGETDAVIVVPAAEGDNVADIIVSDAGDVEFKAAKIAYTANAEFFAANPGVNAIAVTGGGDITFDSAAVEKTSGTAPILRVLGASTAQLNSSSLSSSAAASVIYGENGAKITLTGTDIWSGTADNAAISGYDAEISVTGGNIAATAENSPAISLNSGILKLTGLSASAKNANCIETGGNTGADISGCTLSSAGSAFKFKGDGLNANDAVIKNCTITSGIEAAVFDVTLYGDIRLSSNTIEGGDTLVAVRDTEESPAFTLNMELRGQKAAGDIWSTTHHADGSSIKFGLYEGSQWAGTFTGDRVVTNVTLSSGTLWTVTGNCRINSLNVAALSNLLSAGGKVEIRTNSLRVGNVPVYSSITYGSVRIIVG